MWPEVSGYHGLLCFIIQKTLNKMKYRNRKMFSCTLLVYGLKMQKNVMQFSIYNNKNKYAETPEARR